MSAPRLKVVLTRRLPDAVETRMRELFDAELNLSDAPMDRAALEAAVRRADVLVPTITDAIDAGLIAAVHGDRRDPVAPQHRRRRQLGVARPEQFAPPAGQQGRVVEGRGIGR